MLASQSLDGIQYADGAAIALEQIERFISNGNGLSVGKASKLDQLSTKLDNPDIKEKVRNALAGTKEITEMLEKRESRLV